MIRIRDDGTLETDDIEQAVALSRMLARRVVTTPRVDTGATALRALRDWIYERKLMGYTSASEIAARISTMLGEVVPDQPFVALHVDTAGVDDVVCAAPNCGKRPYEHMNVRHLFVFPTERGKTAADCASKFDNAGTRFGPDPNVHQLGRDPAADAKLAESFAIPGATAAPAVAPLNESAPTGAVAGEGDAGAGLEIPF